MRKQTIILTAGLTTPFLCIALIMAWIFITLDKDKLMADAPPVGAGAGDTGNANALGQLLAGRDPDAISKANDARRSGTAIDPFNWPGGTLLTFTHEPPALNNDATPKATPKATLEAKLTFVYGDTIAILIRHPRKLANGQWGIRLDTIGPNVVSAEIGIGYRTPDSDNADWPMTPIPRDAVEPGSTLASDPITIELQINVVAP